MHACAIRFRINVYVYTSKLSDSLAVKNVHIWVFVISQYEVWLHSHDICFASARSLRFKRVLHGSFLLALHSIYVPWLRGWRIVFFGMLVMMSLVCMTDIPRV